LWIWSGTNWVPALSDASGHFQVDVLTCANPSNLDKTLSTWLPVSKAARRSIALPAANADLLTVAIAPTTSPSLLLVYVCISIVGKIYVTRINGGVTRAEYLNSGVALLAEGAYMFTAAWVTGDTINFRYTTTGGTIYALDVLEVVG
jgi:hypothetical protein